MLSKYLLLNKTRMNSLMIVNLTGSLRTIIHPTPANVEFIQGKSAVGEPFEFKPVRLELEKGKARIS